MGFTQKQMQALQRNPANQEVRFREANGRQLAYIEGRYAITQANRIFGFDAWSRETIESKCVLAKENRGAFTAVYITKVRITVTAGGSIIVREGHGTGEGRGSSPGEVHAIALKAAETDATKRALVTFGKPFGLALYANGKQRSPALIQALGPAPQRQVSPADTGPMTHPENDGDHGGPIELSGATPAEARSKMPKIEDTHPDRNALAAPPVVELSPELAPRRIDKSVLTFGTPKRLRDKAHLRFVATQPCLVCGRQPSDPHHLRFAQPRALGLKVSDEFTVPLCRGHHRLLHQTGNEVARWQELRIDALGIARELWDESHARPAAGVEG
jgi:hypothetical protein